MLKEYLNTNEFENQADIVYMVRARTEIMTIVADDMCFSIAVYGGAN